MLHKNFKNNKCQESEIYGHLQDLQMEKNWFINTSCLGNLTSLAMLNIMSQKTITLAGLNSMSGKLKYFDQVKQTCLGKL